MTNKYRMTRLFRDDVTRLVIPNLKITAIDAITNIVSSYVTNPTRGSDGFFSNWSTRDKFGDQPWDSLDDGVKGMMTRIIDLLVIGIGVTKIETAQEYVMPFSKGIGSTGEVIHLLGAKNEMINVEFKTDRYPGRLGYVLRAMFQKVLETAQVVYLIDDLFLATPCLIKKTKIYKEGTYRGAVMGEIELVSLTTGGSFFEDTIGGKNKVSVFTKKLIGGASSKYNSIPIAIRIGVVGIGAMTVSGALLGSVLGYGG